MTLFFSATTSKPTHGLLEEKFISLLLSCKTQKQLHQVQSSIISHGFQLASYITPKIITVYASFKRMCHALKVFDQIPDPNVSDWNAMFRGYAQNEFHREVLVLFSKMNSMNVRPNCYTFPVVLKSCVKINAFREGEELHCCVTKSGFKVNSFVGTALVDMYSSGGAIRSAYRVFDEMLVRNVVAWTSMITGYISCHDIVSARRLFDLVPERDIVLWNVMVSGYIEAGDMVRARELFNMIPNKDIMSWNTILNGYANSGDVEACERLFEEMPKRNVFSWTILIGGYSHNGRFLEALSAFKRMITDGNVAPNDATLVNALSACAKLGAIDLGKWVHMYAENNGYMGRVHVGNALIDMYAKCGIIEKAVEVFKRMKEKNLISWNTIIGGLAMHGHGADALNLYSEMKNAGEKPDGITFVGVLCACTHMGLVEYGFSHFKSMIQEYSIVPQIEHYGCIVDLLARAGLLDQAMEFVMKMPMEADAVIWATLLGACRIHKNVELAEVALGKLVQFEPNNPANYVTLSNIYRDFERWKDVAQMKSSFRDVGCKKIPGYSLIEVDDSVVEFYCLDERHPERDKIYETLRELNELLRSSGYRPDVMEFGQS